MNLYEKYRQALLEKNYQEDEAQLKMIAELERIKNDLEKSASVPKQSLFSRLFGKKETPNYIKGFYCIGDVGRGKTFIMDLFFDYLPTPRKKRRHYHRFMLELHADLRALGKIENPMTVLVKKYKTEFDILCLDEFSVHDITDAMLLSKLFESFQQENIVLVTTSNVIPDNLYKNGLQRERFLPAIDWIKNHLVVYELKGGEDYRQRYLKASDIFRFPNHETHNEALQKDLIHITGQDIQDERKFFVSEREIPIVARNEHGIIFDFKILCQGNFSQKDYIDIGKRFSYLGLINIPIINEDLEDAGKRFLLLIDEFYDRNVKLLLTSQCPMNEIYQGQKLKFEYQRVQSRLMEMQSLDYWQRPHLT